MDRTCVDSFTKLALQDIIRNGGWKVDLGNFPEGEQQRNLLLRRYAGTDFCENLSLINISLGEVRQSGASVERKTHFYKKAAACASLIKAAVEQDLSSGCQVLGSHYIAQEIRELISGQSEQGSKPFMLVRDRLSGIADIILPSSAYAGGYICTKDDVKLRFWLTPDEVMLPCARRDSGVRLIYSDCPDCPKDKIAGALLKDGMTYIRFYEPAGLLMYDPDDSYFADKEVILCSLTDGALTEVDRFDVRDAVSRAGEIIFSYVIPLTTDQDVPVLYMRPKNGTSVAVAIQKSEYDLLMNAATKGDIEESLKLRRELAPMYYSQYLSAPDIAVDLYGDVPEDIDVARISKVSVYRASDDKMMMLADIDGCSELQPVEITDSQYTRLLVSEDTNRHKTILAANLYADIIRATQPPAREVDPRHKPDLPPFPRATRLDSDDRLNWKLWGTYRKQGEFTHGLSLHKHGRRFLACFEDSRKLHLLYNAEEIDYSTSFGEKICVELSEEELQRRMPDMVTAYGSVVVLDKERVKLYGHNLTKAQVLGHGTVEPRKPLSTSAPKVKLSTSEKQKLLESFKSRKRESSLDGVVYLSYNSQGSLTAKGIDIVPVYKEFDVDLKESETEKGHRELIVEINPERIDDYVSIISDKYGSVAVINNGDVSLYGENVFTQRPSHGESRQKLMELQRIMSQLSEEKGLGRCLESMYRNRPSLEIRSKQNPDKTLCITYEPSKSNPESSYAVRTLDNGLTSNSVQHFAPIADSVRSILDDFTVLAQSASQKTALTQPQATEKAYYTCLSCVTADQSPEIYDNIEEIADDKARLLEFCASTFANAEIDLSMTYEFCSLSSCDSIIAEDSLYAVVDNPNIGTYKIFRKFPESAVLRTIADKGLPSNPTPDISQLFRDQRSSIKRT